MKRIPIDIELKIPQPKFETSFELVKLSFKTYFKSFWFLTKVTLLLFIPFKLIQYGFWWFVDASTNQVFKVTDNSWFGFIFIPLVTPALIYGLASFLKKRKFCSLTEAYQFGLKKWGRVWANDFVAGILILIGLLLLIVPGINLAIAYSLIPTILCFEGSRLKKALKRSREITFKHRGLIFVSGILLGLMFLIPGIFLGTGAEILFEQIGYPMLGDFISNTIDVLFDQIYVVILLLVYLKFKNDDVKDPEEWWILRWAI